MGGIIPPTSEVEEMDAQSAVNPRKSCLFGGRGRIETKIPQLPVQDVFLQQAEAEPYSRPSFEHGDPRVLVTISHV